MPGMTWDADADRKLLLAIISANPVKVDNAAVANMLTTGEMTCTPRAVEERLKKLKKTAQEQGFELKPTDSMATTPAKKLTTPRKKKAVADSGEDAGQADADASPTKKRKTATPKSAKKIKEEVKGEVKSERKNSGWTAVNDEAVVEDLGLVRTQTGSIFGGGDLKAEEDTESGFYINAEFEL